MNTKPKRKYGAVRKGVETAAGTNESVFDKFLAPTAEQPPAPSAPETRPTRVTPVTQPTRVSQEAAPQKDFTRTANSIVRDAVPAGLFTGKGKQLYDYLYQQTRGAIAPKRSARLPREAVMRGAKMSRPTFRTQLSRLVAVGLVRVTEMGGDHLGNLYEVMLPEEAAYPGYPGSPAYPGKELDGQPGQETDPGNPGLTSGFQRASDESKTNIKTKINTDDEAFAKFIAAMKQTAKDITGREVSKAEAERWGELAEVLTTELRIAAGRTTVSSVPAFLAEHLRRRLWKKDQRQLEAEGVEATKRPSEGDSAPAKAAISECPDCFGTGMWYPEGFDKGVARCRHEKLTQGGGAG